MTIAVVRGLKSAPPPAYELMASYNAGRMQRMRFLQMPSAVPMLFTGLRVAAPLSLVGSVLVDLTGAQSGLGYLMLSVQGVLYTAGMFMAVVLVSLIGVALYGLVILLERLVVVTDARIE